MNILILFSQPWKVGGAETHVEALIKGLKDHKIYLAVNKGSDQAKVADLKQKYSYITIIEIQARGVNPVSWAKGITKLASLIMQENIEVISAQQRTAGIWASILHKRTGVPYIVTMHDAWHRAAFKSIYSKVFPRIIVVGQHLTGVLTEQFQFTMQQITKIANGIDFSMFKPYDKELARQQLGLDRDSAIILHVSRLSNIKGAVSLALLDSIEHVINENSAVTLVILGEGPLRQRIEELAAKINERYCNSKVSIYGFTDNICLWYNAADVIVGEGRVAIEALACEKPVVAIRNGEHFFGTIRGTNIDEAINVNFDGRNFVVDKHTMARQIKLAMGLQAEECQEIAGYIRQKLSLEKMAHEYIEEFKHLLHPVD